MIRGAILLYTTCIGVVTDPPDDEALLTVAEKSGFQSTSLHEDVVTFLDRVASESPLASRSSLGQTVERREIPLLIIADPPVRDAKEARATGKVVVLVVGNIHAGEVCGKEALMILAREITDDPDRARQLLDHVVLVLAPIYNADGNERIATGNRPGQIGPVNGMGQRPNAQGLDLNRDHVKLESPESRALVSFLTEWDPDVVIDTHTTNGSVHRYLVTYAAPLSPAGHPAPISLVRDRMLPEVTHRLKNRTGIETFFYGNFDQNRTVWFTYSSKPRFGGPYRGLRGHLSILSEAYSYATFEERVRGTLEFVRECLDYVSRESVSILKARDVARRETVESGRRSSESRPVGIRFRISSFDGTVRVASTLRESGSTKSFPVDYIVKHYGRFEATESVRRPVAYLIPEHLTSVLEKLSQHGIESEVIQNARSAPCEIYRVTDITRARSEFQGHHEVTVEVIRQHEDREIGEGWVRVPMDQPLGTLALFLLEPRSEDGLVTWNFLDPWLEVGSDYPILRETDPTAPVQQH